MKSRLSMLAAASLAAGLLLTQASCTDTAKEAEAENPALVTAVPAGMVRGTVLETMNAGGYTYALIETESDQRWVASQQIPVEVGDVVQVSQGMPMQEFQSKSLNRTFDVVYFVDGMQNLTAAGAPADQPTAGLPPGHPPMPADSGTADAAALTVAAVEEGKDIAWVYANKADLAGQPVSLRGQIVKYNAGILGWNFLHIQDGSGDAADGSNDLIVTTRAEAAVGQTVVVTGSVILDKDFGAGYSYPVLLEDATLAVE